MKKTTPIPARTIERMVLYKRLLIDLKSKGVHTLFSHQLAALAHNTSTQVRRDLMEIGHSGSPRKGYDVTELISNISGILDGSKERIIALVGVGNLGRALLSYGGFGSYGLSIIAGFDTSPEVVGTTVAGKEIFHASRISELCSRLGVHIGIITAPAAAAQSACDALTAGGVRAIWNFAPVRLTLPPGVIVTNENLAASFAALSGRLSQLSRGE